MSDRCPLLPIPRAAPGECDNCPRALPISECTVYRNGKKWTRKVKRQRWCSDKCANEFNRKAARNHDWPEARNAALHRDSA